MSLTLNLARFGALELISYPDLDTNQALEVLNMRNHPEVRRWMHNQEEISLNQHLNFIASLKNNTLKHYFLVLKDKQKLGVLNFTRLATNPNTVELGFFANLSQPNPMAAFILETAALEYTFNILKAEKIYAEVLTGNNNVAQLHRRFGFTQLNSSTADILKLQLLKQVEN